MNQSSISWIEINKEALLYNIKQYKKIVGPQVVLAPVIKSNAYGHGIELVARILEHAQDVGYICVVSLSEALLLRRIGITKPILVLSIIDDSLEAAIVNKIDLVAYDESLIKKINAIAQKLNRKVKVHIKIDTGLSRAGILHTDAVKIIQNWYDFPGIIIEGIFTHFANSESAEQSFAQLQIERFNKLLGMLAQKQINIPLRHTSCSAAITAHPNSHFTFARLGIGTYGLWPSAENKTVAQKMHTWFDLKPILTWKTRIIQIKQIQCGQYVGYDLTYKANRDSKIALLPIGYWDGFDRGFSNNGFVLIQGKLVPVIGRVAMNLTMIDITTIPHAKVGDEVLLLGNNNGITAEDLAQRIGTINYEIVTRINPLLSRVII